MTDYADFGLVYEQKRRAAASQRDGLMSSNAYARTIAQQRGQRDLLDLTQRNTAAIPKLAVGYGRRGLQNSGIYQNAQRDFTSQWAQGQNDVMAALKQKLDELTFSDAGAVAQYDSTAADLQAQKLRDILATAAALRDAQGIGGA